ncbi:MAG: MarR family transcriptional regulator [Chloroflexi bacterium]|nr:MarR family transcriptional regulator [Chloroflexota bacterium]
MERTNNSLDDQARTVEALFDSLVMQGNKSLSEKLMQYDLTVAQYLSMDALHHKGDECSMSELADRIHQSSATMTGIVDRLVEKGWVTRRRSEEDRRAVFVALTPDGQNILNRVTSERHEFVRNTISKIPATDVETFINLMKRYMQAAGYLEPPSSEST